MTRPAAELAGLPNTEVFPDAAKETARHIGMPEHAIQIGRRRETSVAGVRDYTYDWDGPIRGRIDPLGAVGGSGRLSGGQMDATSTHTATLDGNVDISSQDRVRDMETGTEFTVNSIRFHTGQDVTQVEVRQVAT